VLEEWVLALAGSPWIFLALYAFATIDGFFPPIPSESVVIALAALAVATGQPNLWLVGAVAAAGAFSGDQVAYSIGRHLPVRRLPVLRGPRGQHALDWAEGALAQRGASFIITARYIPIGRVAVNMTAGAVGFSRVRFTGLAAIAAVSWSVYSVLLGIGAGVWLGDNPLLAVAVGVAGGLVLGLVIDWAMTHLLRGRRGRAVPSAAVGSAPPSDRTGEATVPEQPLAGSLTLTAGATAGVETVADPV
jgi:membrane-associated protein